MDISDVERHVGARIAMDQLDRISNKNTLVDQLKDTYPNQSEDWYITEATSRLTWRDVDPIEAVNQPVDQNMNGVYAKVPYKFHTHHPYLTGCFVNMINGVDWTQNPVFSQGPFDGSRDYPKSAEPFKETPYSYITRFCNSMGIDVTNLGFLPPMPRRGQFANNLEGDYSYEQARNIWVSTVNRIGVGQNLYNALFPLEKKPEFGPKTINLFYRDLYVAAEYGRRDSKIKKSTTVMCTLKDNTGIISKAIKEYMKQLSIGKPDGHPLNLYRDAFTGESVQSDADFKLPKYITHPSVTQGLLDEDVQVGKMPPEKVINPETKVQYDSPEVGLGMYCPGYTQPGIIEDEEFEDAILNNEAFITTGKDFAYKGPPNLDIDKSASFTAKDAVEYDELIKVRGEPSFTIQNYSAYPIYMIDGTSAIKELPPQIPPDGILISETCRSARFFGKIVMRRYVTCRNTNGIQTEPWYDMGTVILADGPSTEDQVENFQYGSLTYNLVFFGSKENALEFKKCEHDYTNFCLKRHFGTLNHNIMMYGIVNLTDRHLYAYNDSHTNMLHKIPMGLDGYKGGTPWSFAFNTATQTCRTSKHGAIMTFSQQYDPLQRTMYVRKYLTHSDFEPRKSTRTLSYYPRWNCYFQHHTHTLIFEQESDFQFWKSEYKSVYDFMQKVTCQQYQKIVSEKVLKKQQETNKRNWLGKLSEAWKAITVAALGGIAFLAKDIIMEIVAAIMRGVKNIFNKNGSKFSPSTSCFGNCLPTKI